MTRQSVILKMDDLATGWWREWKTLADLVRTEDVRIGFGIFAASLEEGDAAYDGWIADINGDDRFELWFHGYTGNGPNGEPGKEHQGTPYDYQKASFEKARHALLTKCDTIMRTYSEHWHGGDATTLRVFNEDPFLRVWMCWEWAHREDRQHVLPADRKTLPGNMITMECPDPKNWQPGYVNCEEFRKEYGGHEQDPVIVIQGHPWSWTDTSNKEDRTGKRLDRWAEFRKILKFLKDRDARFLTPYGFYRKARGYSDDTNPPAAATGLTAVRSGTADVTLRWTAPAPPKSGLDCFKIYADGKPVGLSTGPEWTGPAAPTAEFSVAAVSRAELASPRSAPVRP